MNAPFLTDLDQRAAIKGSRDPLGMQPIWTRLGRNVVGNLTTVTTSVRDFTVTILGIHFAERLRAIGGKDSDLAIFLRWEQLAAYARASNGDFGFRGTDRVKERLLGARRVTLSAEREHQILSNQKIYGLWGLYSVASEASGFIESDPVRLTPLATEMLDDCVMPTFARHGDREAKKVEALIERTRSTPEVNHEIMNAVAAVLDRKLRAKERNFYVKHLAHGGPTDPTSGEQREFAAILEDIDDVKERLGSSVVKGYIKEAHARGFSSLATHLEWLHGCEAVLAPADRAFRSFLGKDGQTVDSVANGLRTAWGKRVTRVDVARFEKLVPQLELALGDPKAATRWLHIAAQLSEGDYAKLVRTLIEHNAAVMSGRGAGAPWVSVDRGKLKVRFRDEWAGLPNADVMQELFVSPYFITSLRIVVDQLRGARR